MTEEFSLEFIGNTINSQNHIANFSKNYDGAYITINFYREKGFIVSWLSIKIGPYTDGAFGASYEKQAYGENEGSLMASALSVIDNIFLAPEKKTLIRGDVQDWKNHRAKQLTLEQFIRDLSDVGND